MRMRKTLMVAGAGLVLAGAAPVAWATTTTTPPSLGDTRFHQQRVEWGECEPARAALRCARVTVPVDWNRPGGATLQLAVARRAGDGRGTLVVNPGGPGISGIDFLARNAAGPDGYDLVAWDPRGVGRSAGLTCPPDATAAIEAVDGSPDTLAEAKGFEVAATRWARACRAASGPVFDHMDTGSSARDLDVLRAVLGRSKLDYLGISYGTVLGGRYAELFPQRVGRMVLDSAGHPDHTYRTWMVGVTEAKELSLTGYLTGCADRPECPLASMTEGEARRWIRQLLREVDREPLRSGDTTVSQAQLAAVLQRDVADPNGWDRLDAELAELLDGRADIVAMTAPRTTIDIQNVSTTCQDLPDRRTPAEVLRDAGRLARTAPVFGTEVTAGAPCTRWPAGAPVPPHRLHAPGAPPILVVGITRDTAGPYRWSVELTAQLRKARLLTLDAADHGAYLIDPCVRDAADAFLTGGTLPARGTVCRSGQGQ
jgi:pimeloyl-ACP methyl ester carboxylesterase